MKKHKLSESGARGWFIGDFPQAVVRTKDFEANYQVNKKVMDQAMFIKSLPRYNWWYLARCW